MLKWQKDMQRWQKLRKSVTVKPFIDQIPELPPTIPMYYEDVSQQNFEADVLGCLPLVGDDIPTGATHGIILDKTCFYPEGGGQESDFWHTRRDYASNSVLDTRKVGELIIHLTDGTFEVGDDMVHGEIDWLRRRQLMDHHTAVHIVGGERKKITWATYLPKNWSK